jgi:predicted Rossmann fold flavoprotein
MKKVIVIGAGPAGMMAAVKAAENGAQVVLLEKMKRVGKKMSITGKGRCNITNSADIAEIIKNIPGNGVFLHSVLHSFDNQDVMEFFQENGVPVKIERGNRVFPVSDKAEDVVGAMLQKLHLLGVHILTEKAVTDILTIQGRASGVRLLSGETYEADAVVLAVGGASYPGTGSTGDGYKIAKKLGHTVTEVYPSLVPLETDEEWVKDMQGLSLKNVRVGLLIDGEKITEDFGEMMFAHFGVTGPIVLSLSRVAADYLRKGKQVELVIDLKPALTPEKLDARLQRDFEKYIRKQIKNGLNDLLPAKMIAPVIDLAYIDPEKEIHQLTKAERLRIVALLKCLTLTITGTRPMAEAIVTAGGISTREIQPKTMESKLVPGVYFAGEVVDIDGFTGGFNLQAAFSMGAAAGCWSVWND